MSSPLLNHSVQSQTIEYGLNVLYISIIFQLNCCGSTMLQGNMQAHGSTATHFGQSTKIFPMINSQHMSTLVT